MAGPLQTKINPSDQESMPAALEKWFRDLMLDVDDCLPAIVVSYDRASNLATVRPIITRLTVTDQSVPRQGLAEIPVLSIGAGAYTLNFPVKTGDLGWIKAADRDLSNFMNSLEEGAPPTCQTHSFASSLWIPDVFRQYTILPEHEDEAVFQTTDGQNRVALGRNRIKIAVGGAYVEVTDGKVTVLTGGTLDIQSAHSNFSGDVTIAGKTTMNGGFASTGGGGSSCDSLTVAGKKVDQHIHECNSPGTDSGPMKGG